MNTAIRHYFQAYKKVLLGTWVSLMHNVVEYHFKGPYIKPEDLSTHHHHNHHYRCSRHQHRTQEVRSVLVTQESSVSVSHQPVSPFAELLSASSFVQGVHATSFPVYDFLPYMEYL